MINYQNVDNCSIAPILSPDQQEITHGEYLELNHRDYVIILALREIYSYLTTSGEYEEAEYVYRVIDNIRHEFRKKSYEFCNSEGDYVTPMEYCYDDKDNDYLIEIYTKNVGEELMKKTIKEIEYEMVTQMTNLVSFGSTFGQHFFSFVNVLSYILS